MDFFLSVAAIVSVAIVALLRQMQKLVQQTIGKANKNTDKKKQKSLIRQGP
jgi:hypothetical protein